MKTTYNLTLRVITLLGILLLAACAPTTDTTTSPTTAPADTVVAPTQETITNGSTTDETLNLGEAGSGLFSAEITGALTTTLAGPGSYDCTTLGEQLSSGTEGDMMIFTIVPGTAAGEYAVGTGDTTIAATLTIGDANYNAEAFGILTLTSVPLAAGDPVSGTFDMNFVSSRSESVNVVGSFDMLATGVCG